MTDIDGNIGNDTSTSTEQVCGILFDISAQGDFWTKGAGLALADTFKGTIVEFNTLEAAVEAGITPYSGGDDLLNGIPHYHINHFFQTVGGTGRLFVAFADCSVNWNAIVDMQKAAHGIISQVGVWTEQSLWKKTDAMATQYNVQLVGELNAVAVNLANNYHAPLSIVLSANTAKIATASTPETQVVFSMIPSCVVNSRYVSVLLGQEIDEKVSSMQTGLESCTPVGCLGLALGAISTATVAECIGWVQKFNLSPYFQTVEFGFGNAAVVDQRLTNATHYDSLSSVQLDNLDDLGYVFLTKYTGMEGGVYFSGDQTCSDGDYRTIARNRAINKSRRMVRTALLPYVNSPVKVDPATGYLSAAQGTIFKNVVNDVLESMSNNEEISG